MARPKGQGKTPGSGRKKGSIENVNIIRDAILQSFDLIGGAAYLARQAEENPGPYMQLIGKVLPKEISGSLDVKSSVVIKASPLDERI